MFKIKSKHSVSAASSNNVHKTVKIRPNTTSMILSASLSSNSRLPSSETPKQQKKQTNPIPSGNSEKLKTKSRPTYEQVQRYKEQAELNRQRAEEEIATFSFKNPTMKKLFEKDPNTLSPQQFYQLAKAAPPSVIHKQLDHFQPCINELLDGKSNLLHVAAQSNKVDLARELITRGALLNVPDKAGNTPLHLATKTGQPDILRFLVARGADLHATNLLNNQTPLMTAATTFHNTMVYTLLQLGASVDQQNSMGQTALMFAAQQSTRQVIQIFHQFNANIDLFDNNGLTAHDYAQKHQKSEMSNILYLCFSGQRGPKFNPMDDPELQKRREEQEQRDDAKLVEEKLFDDLGQFREEYLQEIWKAVQHSEIYQTTGIFPESVEIVVHKHHDESRYFTTHQDFDGQAIHAMVRNELDGYDDNDEYISPSLISNSHPSENGTPTISLDPFAPLHTPRPAAPTSQLSLDPFLTLSLPSSDQFSSLSAVSHDPFSLLASMKDDNDRLEQQIQRQIQHKLQQSLQESFEQNNAPKQFTPTNKPILTEFAPHEQLTAIKQQEKMKVLAQYEQLYDSNKNTANSRSSNPYLVTRMTISNPYLILQKHGKKSIIPSRSERNEHTRDYNKKNKGQDIVETSHLVLKSETPLLGDSWYKQLHRKTMNTHKRLGHTDDGKAISKDSIKSKLMTDQSGHVIDPRRRKVKDSELEYILDQSQQTKTMKLSDFVNKDALQDKDIAHKHKQLQTMYSQLTSVGRKLSNSNATATGAMIQKMSQEYENVSKAYEKSHKFMTLDCSTNQVTMALDDLALKAANLIDDLEGKENVIGLKDVARLDKGKQKYIKAAKNVTKKVSEIDLDINNPYKFIGTESEVRAAKQQQMQDKIKKYERTAKGQKHLEKIYSRQEILVNAQKAKIDIISSKSDGIELALGRISKDELRENIVQGKYGAKLFSAEDKEYILGPASPDTGERGVFDKVRLERFKRRERYLKQATETASKSKLGNKPSVQHDERHNV